MSRIGIWTGVARDMLRVDRSQLAMIPAVRSAVGIAVPLVAGQLSGHLLIGVEAAIGALTAGMASLQGAYRSRVTTQLGSEVGHAVVAVNSPLSIGAWKLYQVNFDPKDPSYSGMLAVRDPGVPWVFLGFLLTGLGVLYTMTIEPRRRRAEEG